MPEPDGEGHRRQNPLGRRCPGIKAQTRRLAALDGFDGAAEQDEAGGRKKRNETECKDVIEDVHFK